MNGTKRTRGRAAATTQLIDSLPGSPHLWGTLTVACLVAAAGSLLTGHVEAAFVLATLGAVAWFIRLRNSLRGSVLEEDEVTEQGEEDDEESADRNE